MLDLNGLLLCREYAGAASLEDWKRFHPNLRRKPDAKLGTFYVWKRPHADAFLRWLARRGARVGIWSTAAEHNVVMLVGWLLPRAKDRANLSFIWDGSMCTDTGKKDAKNPRKAIVLKELAKLWKASRSMKSMVDVRDSLDGKKYNEQIAREWIRDETKEELGTFNTVLIDDSDVKAAANPPHTAIHPPSWSIHDGDDSLLGRNGTMRRYIAKLLDAPDTQDFIRDYPYHSEELQGIQLVSIDGSNDNRSEQEAETSTDESDSEECTSESLFANACLGCS